MINRERRKAYVRTYAGAQDAYGQSRKDSYSDAAVDMVIHIYSQTQTTDIRYTNVELVCLVDKKYNITDKNAIVIDDKVYNILYIIPGPKNLNQVMVQKI